MASLVLLNSVAHALVKMCRKGSLVAVYRKVSDTGVRANLSSAEERRTFVTVSDSAVYKYDPTQYFSLHSG